METEANKITTLEGLQAELNEMSDKQEFSGQAYDIKSEISLIIHVLSHDPGELSEDEFDGIIAILEGIRGKVALMGEYCHISKNYHFFLKNPDSLAETQKSEKICRGLD